MYNGVSDKEIAMTKKVVETMKTPDGRYIWQIGEVDDMGGGFGCLFVDRQSGSWRRVDAQNKTVYRAGHAVATVYEGEFFPTREDAQAAGRAAL